MSAHELPRRLASAPVDMPDPGNAGSIYVDRSPCVVALVSAGAETRTLARPTRLGNIVFLYVQTYVGNITVTVTGNYDTNSDSTYVMSAAGQFACFISAYDGTNYYWRLISCDLIGNFAKATATATELSLLSGLLATAAEINRTAKVSTRVVSAGGANLTVTQALHDGKTIILDQATGTAVTLPAMAGTGSRYRFVLTVNTSGGSQVITATGAHLFGSLNQNNDTSQGTGFQLPAVTNASGSTVITLDGSTKGGRKGDWFEIEDVAASFGVVRGQLNASGTEASPFS